MAGHVVKMVRKRECTASRGKCLKKYSTVMLVASHSCSAPGSGPEAPVIPGEGSVEQMEFKSPGIRKRRMPSVGISFKRDSNVVCGQQH